MSGTLQDYLYDTRFLLRDSQSLYWKDADLIRNVNKARADLARDSLCTRGLATITITQGQEAYTFNTVLSAFQASGLPASDILWVVDLNLQWGTNIKRSMDYLPWGDFNAQMRVMPAFQSIPVTWSMLGAQTFYVGPIPNQSYSVDVTAIYLPTALANYTDPENALVSPWTDLVALRACRWAKFYERAYGEVQAFDAFYETELNTKLSTVPAYRVPSRYGVTGL